MVRSGSLKNSLSEADFNKLRKMCKDAENITEPSEKDICIVRKDIEFIKNLLTKVNSKKNPTTFLYLERILFCIQVNIKKEKL